MTTEKSSEEATKETNMLPLFIAAKRVKGCSEKSLRYYDSTICNMLKAECQISTEDLRGYLDTCTVSKATLDNVPASSLLSSHGWRMRIIS